MSGTDTHQPFIYTCKVDRDFAVQSESITPTIMLATRAEHEALWRAVQSCATAERLASGYGKDMIMTPLDVPEDLEQRRELGERLLWKDLLPIAAGWGRDLKASMLAGAGLPPGAMKSWPCPTVPAQLDDRVTWEPDSHETAGERLVLTQMLRMTV